MNREGNYPTRNPGEGYRNSLEDPKVPLDGESLMMASEDMLGERMLRKSEPKFKKRKK